MGQLNTELVGSILPGGAPGESPLSGIDITQVLTEILPSLHAASEADLIFWTEAELIEWLDDAVKRLARKAGVFIGRDASTFTTIGQAAYPLPAGHLSTRHVSYGTAQLRPSTTIEMEALDPSYATTAGTPLHWYEDLQGINVVGLAPVPDAETELAVIYEGWPAALDAGRVQTIVPGPPPLKGYLAFCLLASAYGAESQMEMPDVAEHAKARTDLYEQMFISYYGAGF